MTRRTLDRAQTAQQLCAHFDHHPALRGWRQSGSHRIYTGPTGQVIVPCHNGDVANGTRRSICRMAALAGLALVALAALVIMA